MLTWGLCRQLVVYTPVGLKKSDLEYQSHLWWELFFREGWTWGLLRHSLRAHPIWGWTFASSPLGWVRLRYSTFLPWSFLAAALLQEKRAFSAFGMKLSFSFSFCNPLGRGLQRSPHWARFSLAELLFDLFAPWMLHEETDSSAQFCCPFLVIGKLFPLHPWQLRQRGAGEIMHLSAWRQAGRRARRCVWVPEDQRYVNIWCVI